MIDALAFHRLRDHCCVAQVPNLKPLGQAQNNKHWKNYQNLQSQHQYSPDSDSEYGTVAAAQGGMSKQEPLTEWYCLIALPEVKGFALRSKLWGKYYSFSKLI